MKKLIVFICLLTYTIFSGNVYATGKVVKVKVPSKIPGVNCDITSTGSTGAPTEYTCSVVAGFGSIQSSIGAIIKYFTFITGLLGVLYIIISGIMLSMSGVEQELQKTAKEQIKKALIGLILLLLSGLLLNMIAPWIYQ